MKKPVYLFLGLALTVITIANSQNLPTDISFDTNTWTTSGNVVQSGNQYTLTANSSTPSVYLDVPVSNTYTDVYVTAEVEINNVIYGNQVFRAPRIRIHEGGTFTQIAAENLTNHPEGVSYKVGVAVRKYNNMGLTSLRIEFMMQNITGEMIVKNPVITNIEPAMDFAFPFTTPANPTYNLDINTANKHTFNNDLLSTNSHFRFLENQGGYSWSSTETSQIINDWFPQTNFRFPGGTVGNYYNWATDGYYPDGTNGVTVRNYSSSFTFGYNGYKNICIANNASSTLMFNTLIDSPTDSKNRYQSRVNDGLNVKWIELGNENFFNDQQGGYVTNVDDYITHTKNIVTELKTVDPNVKAAVCLEKDYYFSGSWNNSIKQHINTVEDYFDAATIHFYNNTNSFLYSGSTVYRMMQSYKITEERINKFATNFPGKSALITEWGVLSDDMPNNFIQTLASADVFLAMEKGNTGGIVEQAGIHMLWKNNSYSESTLAYHDGSSMKLTALGVMYASLFDVFKNNEVYDAYSSGPELETGLEGMYAKAVDTGSEYKLFVVNKLPVASNLNFSIDGNAYNGNYVIKTFSEDVTTEISSPYADSSTPWSSSAQVATVGVISIPAYSISIVTIQKSTQNCDATEFNVIANGSAECLLADGSWTGVIANGVDTQATFSDESNIVQGGANAFKVQVTQTNTLAAAAHGDVRLENLKYNGDFNGKTVTIDVWAKADANVQVGIQLKIDKVAGGSDFSNGIYPILSSTYTKYTLTANINEATTGITLRLLCGKNVSNFYFDTITGIITDSVLDTEDYNNNDLQLFVNQYEQVLVVKGKLQLPTEVSIFDLQGRRVLNTQLNPNTSENTIDVSTFNTGIYIVKLVNAEQQKTKKVVIK